MHRRTRSITHLGHKLLFAALLVALFGLPFVAIRVGSSLTSSQVIAGGSGVLAGHKSTTPPSQHVDSISLETGQSLVGVDAN